MLTLDNKHMSGAACVVINSIMNSTDTTKLPDTSTSIRRALLFKGFVKKLSCSLSIYTNKYNKK